MSNLILETTTATKANNISTGKSLLLEDPIQFVQDIYKAQNSTVDQLLCQVKNDKNNILKNEVSKIFANESKSDSVFDSQYNFDNIPNITHVVDQDALLMHHRKLVRFDCIITDMYEQEYFVSVINASEQSGSAPLVYKYFQQLSSEQQEVYGDSNPSPDSQNTLERDILLGSSLPQTTAWTLGSSMMGEITPTEFAKSFPQQKAVLKTYDNDLGKFKLLDVVTVIGVLEYSPATQSDSQMTDLGNGDEFPKGPANAEHMPNIHVLAHQANYVLQNQPQLMGNKIYKDMMAGTGKINRDYFNEASQKILAVLTNILNGDKLAARYLLIALISRAGSRENSLLIGNIAVNLSGVKSEQAAILTDFLFQICPLFGSFNLTTQTLSASQFQPKGAADGNGLEESVLGQIATNSVLLFDETKMQSGEIKGPGVDNIKAIAELIEQQQITLDFKYYQTVLQINVACIVLGTNRSILKNTLHLPVNQPNKDYAFDKQKFMQVLGDQQTLDQMRTLMLLASVIYQQDAGVQEACGQIEQFNIPANVAEHIQNVFICKRAQEQKEFDENDVDSQTNNADEQAAAASHIKTNEETMHRWLSLSRYLCFIKGCCDMTVEIFEEALALEKTRLERAELMMKAPVVAAAMGGYKQMNIVNETKNVELVKQTETEVQVKSNDSGQTQKKPAES